MKTEVKSRRNQGRLELLKVKQETGSILGNVVKSLFLPSSFYYWIF